MTHSARPCRVLVVEDDATSREALARILNRHKFIVETAETVRDALAKLEWEPHIILLDLILPDGLGVAVLQMVRNRGLRIKVVLLTGVEQPQELNEITESEPDAIFTKPLNVEQLIEWIRLNMN
jgi:DNA-binding response OmpR family regulator